MLYVVIYCFEYTNNLYSITNHEQNNQITPASDKCIILNQLPKPAVTRNTLNIICNIKTMLSDLDINFTNDFLEEDLPTKCAAYSIKMPINKAKYLWTM